MKLTIVYEPCHEVFSIYEDSKRIVGFDTETDARAYCESRQSVRVIAEYTIPPFSPTAAKPENQMTDSG
jgi:hypothetical protein